MDNEKPAPGIFMRLTAPGDSPPFGMPVYDPNDLSCGRSLSLSGGGYRAALFHLGALRRLNEIGVLSQVDTIASVSGGSIVAAFLALKWESLPRVNGVIPPDIWDEEFAEPFREFTRRDIRLRAALDGGIPFRLRLSKGAQNLEHQLNRLFRDATLWDLPPRPRLLICTTEMTRGDFWTMTRRGIGSWATDTHWILPDLPIALAVACSACFPPVFDPRKIDTEEFVENDQLRLYGPVTDEVDSPPISRDGVSMMQDHGDWVGSDKRSEYLETHGGPFYLIDGGVFDNTGAEAIWAKSRSIVISDGGGSFKPEWKRNPLWRVSRYQNITSMRARLGHLRYLSSRFEQNAPPGTYLSIAESWAPPASTPSLSGQDGGFAPIADGIEPYDFDIVEMIASIRTDMDGFTEGEIAILENHGYLRASYLNLAHDTSNGNVPVVPPHRDWMDNNKARVALARSDKRKVIGHHRGWKSFFHTLKDEDFFGLIGRRL